MKTILPKIVFFLVSVLYAETIDTFYGPLEVEEPVLLELIDSHAMQRLKGIHQYGVCYYTTHREEYNRFDHSIGVFAVLRKNGACLEEQISGLLHDVSHTVFSHVGDWIFGKEHQEDDYQTTIYQLYLSHSGIEEILMKHGFTINQVLPKNQTMLEQKLPDLCADRIDYNIQGAYFQGFLTKEEAVELFNDLRFMDGCWVATRKDLLGKLARFSLFMTEDCWGSPYNYALSRWLADAMIRGLDIGLLSWKEIHFGIDEDIWGKLLAAEDPYIQERMGRIIRPNVSYKRVEPEDADFFVKFRCRGIDPWVLDDGKTIRLSFIDQELAKKFEILKEMGSNGWPIKILN